VLGVLCPPSLRAHVLGGSPSNEGKGLRILSDALAAIVPWLHDGLDVVAEAWIGGCLAVW
jgi:hypothetical protein